MQRTPAGLPCGMPGIGEEMEGAMQQAPQPARHSMGGPSMDYFALVSRDSSEISASSTKTVSVPSKGSSITALMPNQSVR